MKISPLRVGLTLCLGLFFGALDAQPIQLIRSKKTTVGLGSGINILVGNVLVRQGEATVACDSLWWDTRSQRLSAHGQVVYRKGKEWSVQARSMNYDQVVAQFQGNVRAQQKEARIQTEVLTVFQGDGSARWNQPATLQLKDGSLTCRSGTLNSKTGRHKFDKSVIFKQKDSELRTESLEYDESSRWGYLPVPGTLTRDSTRITFNAGRWHAGNEEGFFWGNAAAEQPHFRAFGDTLGIHPEGWSASGKARVFRWQNGDSLALHARTLLVREERWLAGPDARFWTPDFQAASDSLIYHTSDSTLLFLRKNRPPVAFSGSYQIQSDTLFMVWRSQKSDSLYMGGNPLISGWNDSNQVDQMAGKRAFGFFNPSGLELVQLRRNAQAKYHTWDNDSYLGINTITGPILTLYFNNSELNQVRITGSTSGVLDPPNPEKPAELLPGYSDRRSERLSKMEAISGRK